MFELDDTKAEEFFNSSKNNDAKKVIERYQSHKPKEGVTVPFKNSSMSDSTNERLFHIVHTERGYIESFLSSDSDFTFTNNPDKAVLWPLDLPMTEYKLVEKILREKYNCLTHKFIVYLDHYDR